MRGEEEKTLSAYVSMAVFYARIVQGYNPTEDPAAGKDRLPTFGHAVPHMGHHWLRRTDDFH